MTEGPAFGLRPSRLALAKDFSCACSRTPAWQPQNNGWSAYASSEWPAVETADDTRNSCGLLHSAWQPLQDTKQGQTYSYHPDFPHHTWGSSTEVTTGTNLE